MIKYYFGSPGSGKTTVAVVEALKAKKYYRNCVANFSNDIPGVYYDNMSELGKYRYPESTLILIDEAGVQYNNRSYKSFSKDLITFFKMHRHYDNDIIVFSQSWEDVDITVRRLTDELWYLRKLGPFTLMRRVKKFVTVSESDYQIINGYRFSSPIWTFLPRPIGFSTIKLIFRPLYYKYFDSYSDDYNVPVLDLNQLK